MIFSMNNIPKKNFCIEKIFILYDNARQIQIWKSEDISFLYAFPGLVT